MEPIYRLEIRVPKEGNSFVQIPQESDSKSTQQIYMRLSSGHSFLSGNDVVFFDGNLFLDLRVTTASGRKAKLTTAIVGGIIQKMRQALTFGNVIWDSTERAISISLMEDVTVPVSESSKKILKRLEKALQIPKNNLVKQSDWFLRTY